MLELSSPEEHSHEGYSKLTSECYKGAGAGTGTGPIGVGMDGHGMYGIGPQGVGIYGHGYGRPQGEGT